MEFTDQTEALLRSLFATNDKGDVSLRVVLNDDGPGLGNAASTQSSKSLETMLKQCVVLDVDGNPAIRLTNVLFGTTIEDAARKRILDNEAEVARVKEEQRAERLATQAATPPAKPYRPPGTVEKA